MRRNRLYLILLFVFSSILFVIPNRVSANVNSEYTIEKYDINIVVNEDNTLFITENIIANYNVEKHGIFRKIPIRNTVVRNDGTKSKNLTKLTDVKVNAEFSSYIENGYTVIKIGDPNLVLTGMHSYEISYLYNLGKDPLKEIDEFYFNLIGPEWDTSISNVTFTITMPKEFDSSKLGFSSGAVGSTDSSNVNYEIEGNVIVGKFIGTLSANEALTVRMELPDGYFVDAGIPVAENYYLMFLVPGICVLVSYLIWLRYGKDNPVIETVEFYPPEGFNSLEVGFLYKGKAENMDVTSLLIYLANKGYIKISESQTKSIFSSSNDFVITKLKEYDGSNVNEKMFLEGLFEHENPFNYRKVADLLKQAKASGQEIELSDAMVEGSGKTYKDSVTNSDLYDSFYKTMNKILLNVNNQQNKDVIFDKKNPGKSAALILLLLASFITTVAIPTLEYGGYGELGMSLFIMCFYIPFYAVGLFSNMPLFIRIFWLGFVMFHSGVFFSTLPISTAVIYDYRYLVAVLYGIFAVIVIGVLFKLLPKRTPYGNEMLGKLRGFKRFLETAEKQKLEQMVMQHPTYFYDILPYTYVLGVSDKWIEKFESISLQAPNWYDGYSSFNASSFGRFMTSTMSSASSSMSSSSSGGSGGSSGGGSSGGGSGGGGGGSW